MNSRLQATTSRWIDGLTAPGQARRGCAQEVAAASGVRCTLVDVHHLAYRLIQPALVCDGIAAPKLCGDVLADLHAAPLISRGPSCAGDFGLLGEATFQTNSAPAPDGLPDV